MRIPTKFGTPKKLREIEIVNPSKKRELQKKNKKKVEVNTQILKVLLPFLLLRFLSIYWGSSRTNQDSKWHLKVQKREAF